MPPVACPSLPLSAAVASLKFIHLQEVVQAMPLVAGKQSGTQGLQHEKCGSAVLRAQNGGGSFLAVTKLQTTRYIQSAGCSRFCCMLVQQLASWGAGSPTAVELLPLPPLPRS